ncbi:hypothetical protein ACU8OG_20700 [Rhizobium leguminosarum]
MTQNTLRTVVSLIVIFGHLLVFFAGAVMGAFVFTLSSDAIQTVLMASPVLGVTAASSMRYIFSDQALESDATTRPLPMVRCVIAIAFPISLLIAVFLILCTQVIQLDNFGPDKMKIYLGAVETFFGIYLGLISDSLFGSK